MGKKGTIEEMREIAKEKGWECLSKKYINCRNKIRWKCNKCKHIWLSTSHTVKRVGVQCPKCSKYNGFINSKKTIEDIKDMAEKKGFEFISKEFISINNLKFKCIKEHIFTTSFAYFKTIIECSQCRKENINRRIEAERLRRAKIRSDIFKEKNKKIKEQYLQNIQKIAQENGCECLSKEYICNKIKMEFKCIKNHTFFQNYNSLIYGHWCPYCSKRFIRKETEYNQLKKKFNINKYALLTQINNFKNGCKITISCPKGHIYVKNYYYKQETKIFCEECKKNNIYNNLKDVLNKKNIIILSKKYINCRNKMQFECDKGHFFKTFPKKNIIKCPRCSSYKTEEHCRKIFEDIFKVKFEKKRYKWLKLNKFPLELDGCNNTIITPLGYGLAFEYNGMQHYKDIKYFKGSILSERKKYDKFKIEKCKERGVLLIIIPYWIKYKDIKDYIIEQLQINGVLLTSIKMQKKITEYINE